MKFLKYDRLGEDKPLLPPAKSGFPLEDIVIDYSDFKRFKPVDLGQYGRDDDNEPSPISTFLTRSAYDFDPKDPPSPPGIAMLVSVRSPEVKRETIQLPPITDYQ